MAVPSLAKLKTIKLTKLQALLLLGGAFVSVVGIWTVTHYHFLRDTTPQVPANSVLALRFMPIGPVSRFEAKRQKIVSVLPLEAQQAINLAGQGQAWTLFAVPGEEGSLQWWILEAMNSTPQGRPVWRLVSNDVDAVGFVLIGGRKQPIKATFGSDHATFRIGRAFSGFLGAGPVSGKGRMNVVPHQDTLYLEKPEGASWGTVPSLIGQKMQRFEALSAFWALPGRVELSVSASGTEAVLQPFTLYYRPIASVKTPRSLLENYAKRVLADAFPQPIEVKLPDGSLMQELRRDPVSVQSSMKKNLFGNVVKFTYPNQKEGLDGFYMDSGESWLTTDLTLVEAAYMGKFSATDANDVCHRGGAGGYAMIPGSFLPFSSGFTAMSVTIHSLETGLLTMCGYY